MNKQLQYSLGDQDGSENLLRSVLQLPLYHLLNARYCRELAVLSTSGCSELSPLSNLSTFSCLCLCYMEPLS